MNKEKIKILFIISNLNLGGAEILLLNICRGLYASSDKFEIKIFTFFSGDALKSDFEKIGIPIKSLELSKYRSVKSLLNKNIQLFKFIREFNPHIVHTQLLGTDRYGQITAYLAGIKNRICTVHNIENEETFEYKITRFVTSVLATRIIFVSKCAMDHYCSIKSYPLKKSIVIYNSPGFRENNFSPRVFDLNKKLIKLVSIGRLHPQKGHIYLIKAMKFLETSNYSFELAIYGADFESNQKFLESEIEKSGLKHIFFKGISKDVVNILKSADIYISSSLFEAAPLVILEAMTAGIPIIATDISPHREILGEIPEYNSFVSAKNSTAISESIIKMVSNPVYYNTISANEINRSKDYSVDNMVQKYYEFYNSQLS